MIHLDISFVNSSAFLKRTCRCKVFNRFGGDFFKGLRLQPKPILMYCLLMSIFQLNHDLLGDLLLNGRICYDWLNSSLEGLKITSNDIIAGNGRILSVHEYCVVIYSRLSRSFTARGVLVCGSHQGYIDRVRLNHQTLKTFSTLAKIHTTTAREPSIYAIVP